MKLPTLKEEGGGGEREREYGDFIDTSRVKLGL